MAEKELTMEETFEALELVMQKLESGDTSLEEAFTIYQKGVELLKQCNSKIDLVEKKMKILNENGELSEF